MRSQVRAICIRFVILASSLIWLAPRPTRGQQTPPAAPPPTQSPAPQYDPSIFQNPIPVDQLTFLTQFARTPAGELVKDKQFGKLLQQVLPNCIFHYGWDMPLSDAVHKVLTGSPLLVQIRNGRYLIASGRSGPYLGGRGFVWIDLHDGIALGGFFFRPTNGEPTPTLTVFSKQVKEDALAMSQLPPAFTEDLWQWMAQSRVPPVITRYFITGANRKILLDHDEDYCAPVAGAPPLSQPACQQMNADAADIDLTAAYYLEHTHYATNATAWMMPQEQVLWIQVRESTCRANVDPLRCRVILTREHTHLILRRSLAPHPPHR